MKQPTFADLAYENKKKVTRKERFLGEMDSVLPWQVMLKSIKKSTPKDRAVAHQCLLKRFCESISCSSGIG